jgi:DNA-binding transcriptional regulator/RsmH inhibitor MraZ
MSAIPHFTGYQVHKLDLKYRVAIPAVWRNGTLEAEGDDSEVQAVDESSDESFVLLEATRFGHTYIRVMTSESLADHVQSIRNRPDTPAYIIEEVLEYFFSMIYRIKLSPQGKILIPEKWCQRVGLVADGKVTLAGRGNFFEIWNCEAYQTVKQRERERLMELMPELRIF